MIYYLVPIKSKKENNYHSILEPSLKKKENLVLLDEFFGDSIFQKYNNGYKYLENKLSDNDILLFVHDDVTILDENLENKLEMVFKYKQKVGVCGVIGTNVLTNKLGWWHSRPNTYGHIMQVKNSESFHMVEKNGIGFFDKMLTVDGCFMAVRSKTLQGVKFDETFQGYDFYDINYCLDVNIKKEYTVSIADILIKHESIGELKKQWHLNRMKTFKKYNLEFPITLDSL